MAISPQRLTIYLYSAHRAVFAIAQLSCLCRVLRGRGNDLLRRPRTPIASLQLAYTVCREVIQDIEGRSCGDNLIDKVSSDSPKPDSPKLGLGFRVRG